MHLFDDSQQRVPVAAYQKLIVSLLTDYRTRVEAAMAASREVPAHVDLDDGA